MSDIFLSYASEDLERVKILAETLQAEGWSVFYDRTIPPGKTWRQFIGKEIDACRCMMVAWSEHSIGKHWVAEEADIGLEREILIPLLLDRVRPPLGFRNIHAADLVNWQGEENTSGYIALCKAVTELISPGTAPPSNNDNAPIITLHQSRRHTTELPSVAEASPSPMPRSANPIIINIVEPEMAPIPAGSFQMGSNDRDSEKPVHLVKLKSFYLGHYPVTFDEYDRYAEAVGKSKPDDNGWGRGRRPVINVSWEQAAAYAAWLAKMTGKRYRLPTEAEWEYAARAGTMGNCYWEEKGKTTGYAWFEENSENQTHPVGQKQPNAFGLYDMSGNVWEWVQDCWHDNYQNVPDDGSAWHEQLNGNRTQRVIRGGSWGNYARDLRSANRYGYSPVNRSNFLGFRLAQDF